MLVKNEKLKTLFLKNFAKQSTLTEIIFCFDQILQVALAAHSELPSRDEFTFCQGSVCPPLP